MNQAIKQTIYKGLCAMEILCNIGIVLYIIGSAGSYENDLISTSTFLLRMLVSFVLLFIL